MSETLDLASTIGTWIGAGVGIIALIGIVGPALIWYASTQERQKSLNAVGRNNNDYLSPGYHLGLTSGCFSMYELLCSNMPSR